MKWVVFGLSVSSAWGNSHATQWRGLCKQLAQRGHEVTFFEKDTPYYGRHRDLTELEGGHLVIYSSFESAKERAREALSTADAAVITSFCPDGLAATELVLAASRPRKVFYDLDTPVTLAAIEAGLPLTYVKPGGLARFDLALTCTSGPAVSSIEAQLGAQRVGVLYCHADPALHRPVRSEGRFASDLSYLGTYSEGRRFQLDELFFEPARCEQRQRFMLGGAMYPEHSVSPKNVKHFKQVAPAEQAAFYCSSRATLSVPLGTTTAMGHCPPGQLFEAAACGVPVITDYWDGIEEFFTPGHELIVARTTHQVLAALSMPSQELDAIGKRGRERVLRQHTAAQRANELEQWMFGDGVSAMADSAVKKSA